MSSQPDHKLELESQFVLRLPPAQAEVLRQAIRTGEPLGKRLSVKFDNDIRHGQVKLDNWTMPARLYDLPTIIESYKTLDRKNFYKTADISQILICREDNDSDTSSIHDGKDDEETKKAKYDKLFSSVGGIGKREFLFPHGITPPLKNVRKRRFRKTLRKKYVDFSEIEKEVKRLFRFDCEAIDSRFEIVEESKADKVQPTTFTNKDAPSPMIGEPGQAGMQSTENSQNIDLNDLFGEDYSSSDESVDDDDDDDDDAEDDRDLDDKDIEQDANSRMDFDEQDDSMPAPEPVQIPAADIAAEVAAASDLIAEDDDTEEKRQELTRELAKIKERIEVQEKEMMNLDNQALRMRLKSVLDSLYEQENEIRKQIDELSNRL